VEALLEAGLRGPPTLQNVLVFYVKQMEARWRPYLMRASVGFQSFRM